LVSTTILQTGRAQISYGGIVTIASDGSIIPSIAPISTSNNVTYLLTDNINGTVIIEKDDVIFNGMNFTVAGNPSFRLSNVTHVSILYTIIAGSVQLNSADENIVAWNSMENCEISCENSSGNTIAQNSMENYGGIHLHHSSNNNSVIGNNLTKIGYPGITFSGIDVLFSSGNSIIGNNVKESYFSGIHLGTNASDNVVSDNNLSENAWFGLLLDSGGNNSIIQNEIKGNHIAGIYASGNTDGRWSGNIMSSNNVTENSMGIFIGFPNVTLRRNSISANDENFGISTGGIANVSWFLNDIDTSNTVEGKPIYYWINETNKSVPSDAGYVALINCANITARNLSLNKNVNSLVLAFTSNSTIEQNNVTDNGSGIVLQNSSSNVLMNNELAQNEVGIGLTHSSRNTLRNNSMNNNTWNFDVRSFGSDVDDVRFGFLNDIDATNTVDDKPIYYWIDESNKNVPTDAGCVVLVNCTNITAQNLTLSKNGRGVILFSTTSSVIANNGIVENSVGIELDYSSNNSLNDNRLAGNRRMDITFEQSFNNSIVGNSIRTQFFLEGISFQGSSNNTLYHNNLFSCTIFSYDSLNHYDYGYPIGGNFWSDHTGSDVFSGPYQNETGFDWIGDTPYVIDQNNTDHYPLMQPFEVETEDLRLAYRGLLLSSHEISSELALLNSTINDLRSNVTWLQGKYDATEMKVSALQEKIISLNSTVQSLKESLDSTASVLNTSISNLQSQLNTVNSTLQASINSLREQNNELNNQLNNILYVLYVVTALAAISFVATIYLVMRRPRTSKEST
jgi:parallel beta-helix repeat protein